jgi:hypothetical protein
VPDERQQLASIAAVAMDLDKILDKLSASVTVLKSALGIPEPDPSQKEAAAVTDAAPRPEPASSSPGGALTAITGLQAAIEAMSENLQTVTGRLATTEKRELRARRVIRTLVISLILDVALTIGVTVSNIQAHVASDRANSTVAALHASQIGACKVGDQTRADQVQLWTFLTGLSGPAPGATPAQIRQQKRITDKLLGFVHDTFKQINCAKLYKLH